MRGLGFISYAAWVAMETLRVQEFEDVSFQGSGLTLFGLYRDNGKEKGNYYLGGFGFGGLP